MFVVFVGTLLSGALAWSCVDCRVFVVMLFGNKALVICGFCLMVIYLTLLSCDL